MLNIIIGRDKNTILKQSQIDAGVELGCAFPFKVGIGYTAWIDPWQTSIGLTDPPAQRYRREKPRPVIFSEFGWRIKSSWKWDNIFIAVVIIQPAKEGPYPRIVCVSACRSDGCGSVNILQVGISKILSPDKRWPVLVTLKAISQQEFKIIFVNRCLVFENIIWDDIQGIGIGFKTKSVIFHSLNRLIFICMFPEIKEVSSPFWGNAQVGEDLVINISVCKCTERKILVNGVIRNWNSIGIRAILVVGTISIINRINGRSWNAVGQRSVKGLVPFHTISFWIG